MTDFLSVLTPIATGIGLAAACGFRAFLPLCIASLAQYFHFVELNESMQWVGSLPMLIASSTATVIEILGYYIPFVDHILDIIHKPIAIVGGILLAASSFYPAQQELQWALPIIVGGGIAGGLHFSTSALRLGSTATTGGLGNSILSTFEWFFSLLLSLVAIVFPVLVFILLFSALLLLVLRFNKKLKAKNR